MKLDEYEITSGIPAAEEYVRLREKAGLSHKSVKAAKAGLPNTLFCAIIRHQDNLVGMGRIIGDGALFCQIVDIAVEPKLQGRGLGKAILNMLVQHLEASAAGAHVSLIADGEAQMLYAQFGFSPTAPASIGMARIMD